MDGEYEISGFSRSEQANILYFLLGFQSIDYYCLKLYKQYFQFVDFWNFFSLFFNMVLALLWL